MLSLGRRVTSGARVVVCRPLLPALLATVMLWLAGTGTVLAHAHLVQADPAPDSVLAHVPTTGEFSFDEPLNTTLTRVRITDAAGREVAGSGGHLAPGHNNELWLVPLPSLAGGTYSVFWTSESATDGHVMSSFYTFQVAASGGTGGVGAVTGSAGGSYGGQTSSSSNVFGLGAGAAATVLLHWIGLVAQALWLGSLLIEVLVLGRARRTSLPDARLAWAATARLIRLVRGALLVTLLALIGEVLALALQGTGGDWSRALAPGTLGGILSSQNGHVTVARLVLLLLSLALAVVARVPGGSSDEKRPPRTQGPTAGIAVTQAPRWSRLRSMLAGLALLYMALVAFSGHAANVTPGWLSYAIDWLHLTCTAAWVGGIAALAYGVLPLRRLLSPGERAPAVLPLLDRFSPVAYTAVLALALSGLYNAVNHLAAPSVLFDSTYGQLLIVKLGLVGLLLLFSASHVYLLRPRMVRAQPAMGYDATAAATVHEGLATLAGRLRLEAGIGAGVLLATALMGQTLPSSSAGATAPPPEAATPAAISGTTTTGDLRGTLTVAPPAVGSTALTLALQEKGIALNEDTAGAIIHLYPAGQPGVMAPLTVTAQGTRFTALGSLASPGRWRADVLVRTVTVAEYRTLPFTFTVGAGAGFLGQAENPAVIGLAISPGRLTEPNTVIVSGVPGSGVRLLSEDLDMRMGQIPYPAVSLGGGRWRATNVYPLMNGRWALTVEVQRGGSWVALRRFIYQVPLQGPIRPLSSGASLPVITGTASTVAPGAVRWAGLPYRAAVSFVDNGLVYVPGQSLLTHVGQQNHSIVRAPDGTMWVTDYLGNRVAVLDAVSGRIIGSIAVGLAPVHIAFAPGGRRAYVSNFLSGNVSIVDVRRRRVVDTVAVQLQPHGLAVTPDGRQVWVPCTLGGGVWVIDTRTNRVVSTVFTGGFPHAVTFSPDGRTAYLTDATPGAQAGLFVIDRATGAVRTRVTIGTGSAMILSSRTGRRLYITGQAGSVLTVLDAVTLHVVARVPVGKAPHGLAFTPDGRLLYVAANDGRHVAVVDMATNRVVAIVPVPGAADELALAR